ncbi:MAG: biopolymer transporter ExbD [Elainella sp.]
MKLDYESTEPDVRIEIVPLIDVIFCILTFFILAAVTLTRQAAINVDLPRASSGATQMRQTLIVSVDPIGQVYVEKLPVNRDQLYQAIVSFRQQNPEGMMVLYASRSASYNDVVQVLDLLREAGGDRVALATLPGETGQTPGAGQTPIPNLTNPNPFPSIPAPNSLSPSPGQGSSQGSDDLFNLGTPGAPRNSPGLPGLQSPGSTNPGLTAPSPTRPTLPNGAAN